MTALYQSAPCRCGACRTFVVIETRLHQPVATAPTAWSAARFASAMNIAAEGGIDVLEPDPDMPSGWREWARVAAQAVALASVGYVALVLFVTVASS